MLELLLTGIVFGMHNQGMVKKTNNMNVKNNEDKNEDEIMWFTCPHCNETYDVDEIDDDDMLCPICGLDIEEDYDEDLELDEEISELYQVIGEMKEYIEYMEKQMEEMKKRIKNLEKNAQ